MRSAPDKVSMADAIAAIRKCGEEGVQVLGVDGFVAVTEGFLAPLDLLLDVSDKGLTAGEAAVQAEAFVLLKDRPDVLWEVWTETTDVCFPPEGDIRTPNLPSWEQIP